MKSLEVWYQNNYFGFKTHIIERPVNSEYINGLRENPFIKIKKIIQR